MRILAKIPLPAMAAAAALMSASALSSPVQAAWGGVYRGGEGGFHSGYHGGGGGFHGGYGGGWHGGFGGWGGGAWHGGYAGFHGGWGGFHNGYGYHAGWAGWHGGWAPAGVGWRRLSRGLGRRGWRGVGCGYYAGSVAIPYGYAAPAYPAPVYAPPVYRATASLCRAWLRGWPHGPPCQPPDAPCSGCARVTAPVAPQPPGFEPRHNRDGRLCARPLPIRCSRPHETAQSSATRPMTTMAMRSAPSVTRNISHAPACPPAIAPAATASAAHQCTSCEKTKIRTAEAFMTAGQHVFRGTGVADGQAGQCQRRQHQHADAAAEIAAIDRDAELRCRQPSAETACTRPVPAAAKEAAPGEYAGCEQHQERHQPLEEALRRASSSTAPTAPPTRLISASALTRALPRP